MGMSEATRDARENGDAATRASLQQGEARSRALVENLPIGVYRTTPDGRIVHANPALVEMLGYASFEELATRNLEQEGIATGAPRSAFRERIERDGAIVGKESAWRRRDGTTIFIRENAKAIRDEEGRVVCYEGTVEDITERKRAEEALRQSESFLSDVFASIQDGISVLDTRLNIVRVNVTMEEWYARSMPLPGKKCYEAYHGRSRPCEGCPTIETLRTGESASGTVTRAGPDGEVEAWMNLYSFPLFDKATGMLSGVIEYVRDITQRTLMEKERQRLEEQMKQTQKLESLGVMAGGIAHEFNNLLMGVLGNADLALEDLTEASPARQCVREIRKTGRRAAELTKQMLAYSGRGRLAIEAINLGALIEEMDSLLRASISKKATLEYDFSADPPTVEGDASQLRQLIMNLVTNASEAIEERASEGDSGGVIHIRAGVMRASREYLADSYVDDGLPAGPYVFLEVRDTGCGMDKDTQARIFDPFFTTKFVGRGLGLAAALGIVRGHRGAMRVESEPGHGSLFQALIPCAGAALGGEPVSPSAAPARRRETRILVVDDEESVREVARKILERAGYGVVTACDGEEALQIFRARGEEIAAVLLDLTMPRMDGEETFRHMREIRGDVPVILSSGYTREEAHRRFGDNGLAGFLQKPYRSHILSNKVRRVLEA